MRGRVNADIVEREQKSGAVGCFIMGMFAFMLLPLYVLSIGPADWIGRNYPGTQDILMAVYFPVGITANVLPPFGSAIEWYLGFWR